MSDNENGVSVTSNDWASNERAATVPEHQQSSPTATAIVTPDVNFPRPVWVTQWELRDVTPLPRVPEDLNECNERLAAVTSQLEEINKQLATPNDHFEGGRTQRGIKEVYQAQLLAKKAALEEQIDELTKVRSRYLEAWTISPESRPDPPVRNLHDEQAATAPALTSDTDELGELVDMMHQTGLEQSRERLINEGVEATRRPAGLSGIWQNVLTDRTDESPEEAPPEYPESEEPLAGARIIHEDMVPDRVNDGPANNPPPYSRDADLPPYTELDSIGDDEINEEDEDGHVLDWLGESDDVLDGGEDRVMDLMEEQQTEMAVANSLSAA